MSTQTVKGELRMVALAEIHVEEGFNPRTVIERKELDDLVRSVKVRGVVTPVRLAPLGDASGYRLVAGERRYRAAELAGRTEVQAIVEEPEHGYTGLDLAMLENAHRRDLDPVDEAKGYARLMNQSPLSTVERAIRRRQPASHAGLSNPLLRFHSTTRSSELEHRLNRGTAVVAAAAW